MMFTDADSNDNAKYACLPADDIAVSYRYQSTESEIVPLATDDPHITESDSGDCAAQSKHKNSSVVKREPVHVPVCSVVFYNCRCLLLYL